MASSQGDVRPSPIDGIPAASIHPASGGWVPGRCQNSRYFHGQRRGLSPQTTAPEHDRVESCAITLKHRFRQISPWMRSSKSCRPYRLPRSKPSGLRQQIVRFLLTRTRARAQPGDRRRDHSSLHTSAATSPQHVPRYDDTCEFNCCHPPSEEVERRRQNTHYLPLNTH